MVHKLNALNKKTIVSIKNNKKVKKRKKIYHKQVSSIKATLNHYDKNPSASRSSLLFTYHPSPSNLTVNTKQNYDIVNKKDESIAFTESTLGSRVVYKNTTTISSGLNSNDSVNAFHSEKYSSYLAHSEEARIITAIISVIGSVVFIAVAMLYFVRKKNKKNKRINNALVASANNEDNSAGKFDSYLSANVDEAILVQTNPTLHTDVYNKENNTLLALPVNNNANATVPLSSHMCPHPFMFNTQISRQEDNPDVVVPIEDNYYPKESKMNSPSYPSEHNSLADTLVESQISTSRESSCSTLDKSPKSIMYSSSLNATHSNISTAWRNSHSSSSSSVYTDALSSPITSVIINNSEEDMNAFNSSAFLEHHNSQYKQSITFDYFKHNNDIKQAHQASSINRTSTIFEIYKAQLAQVFEI
ncbi:MAG: hypothetical protein EXX96DRAFT_622821 [Benjaminiella poitrasii]|nr:MAG: hypothetical protein EXX96DRAFT_622821 [Benjaminiella poitrasii]